MLALSITQRSAATLSRGLLRSLSAWSAVPAGPPDPILGVTEAFKADKDPRKINLGVGAYRDESGKPYVLNSVKKAEEIVAASKPDKEYLPINGHPEFTKRAALLAYGSDCDVLKQGAVAVTQSISGTGALRIGGAFLAHHYPYSKIIYLPTPSWGNHTPIFRDSGLEVRGYRYFDKNTVGLDFEGLKADLYAAPEHAIVLLHACAHNPTGIDPTQEQWMEISNILKKRKLFPFFDMAYQGFASGSTSRDAFAVRHFVSQGHQIALAQSFAKNMGLYGERVGAFSFTTQDPEEKARIDSQLKIVIRPMYSNPPIHGARIANAILGDSTLYSQWEGEVKGMADRIINMREKLYDTLAATLRTPGEWGHIKSQIGMFSFTGLTPSQTKALAEKAHVYMTADGRISMAGLNSGNIEYFAESVDAAFLNADEMDFQLPMPFPSRSSTPAPPMAWPSPMSIRPSNTLPAVDNASPVRDNLPMLSLSVPQNFEWSLSDLSIASTSSRSCSSIRALSPSEIVELDLGCFENGSTQSQTLVTDEETRAQVWTVAVSKCSHNDSALCSSRCIHELESLDKNAVDRSSSDGQSVDTPVLTSVSPAQFVSASKLADSHTSSEPDIPVCSATSLSTPFSSVSRGSPFRPNALETGTTSRRQSLLTVAESTFKNCTSAYGCESCSETCSLFGDISPSNNPSLEGITGHGLDSLSGRGNDDTPSVLDFQINTLPLFMPRNDAQRSCSSFLAVTGQHNFLDASQTDGTPSWTLALETSISPSISFQRSSVTSETNSYSSPDDPSESAEFPADVSTSRVVLPFTWGVENVGFEMVPIEQTRGTPSEAIQQPQSKKTNGVLRKLKHMLLNGVPRRKLRTPNKEFQHAKIRNVSHHRTDIRPHVHGSGVLPKATVIEPENKRLVVAITSPLPDIPCHEKRSRIFATLRQVLNKGMIATGQTANKEPIVESTPHLPRRPLNDHSTTGTPICREHEKKVFLAHLCAFLVSTGMLKLK
ncbi:hypothetical protein AX17_000721 [Amanita inopinata Kibby_2008]|nr:hypothetical protein AX17_000721 [Amanita inopinata Kibby_2008]